MVYNDFNERAKPPLRAILMGISKADVTSNFVITYDCGFVS